MRDGKRILSVFLSAALLLGNTWMLSDPALAGTLSGRKPGDVFDEAMENAGKTLSDLADQGQEILNWAGETVEECVRVVNGKLEPAGELTGDMKNSALDALTDAGEKAAEAVEDARKTVINGVEVLGDSLKEQIEFIGKYQVGETKLVETSKGKYDLYISHTVLVLLNGASGETMQDFLQMAVPDAAMVFSGLKGIVLYGMLESSIEKLLEIDEGAGVIIHLDLTSLEGISDSVLMENTEAQEVQEAQEIHETEENK